MNKTTLTFFSRRDSATGMTLLEVIAAIAILGTILVGIVLAKSRHRRQLARSEQVEVVVRAAEELLSSWWVRPDGVPVGIEGTMQADPPLRWRTREIANSAIETLGARVVRLEIIPGNLETLLPGGKVESLFYVDLVLSPEEPREEDAQKQKDASPSRAGTYTTIPREQNGSTESPPLSPQRPRGVRQQDIWSVEEELQTRGRRE